MVCVDGLDGILAATTQRLAMAGRRNTQAASLVLGTVVVIFTFGLGAPSWPAWN